MSTLYADRRADGTVILYADPDRRERRVTIPPTGKRPTRQTRTWAGASLVWLPALLVCPVIPRVAHDGAEWSIDLFLPADPANPGRMVVWALVGGHGEAWVYYFRKMRPPRTPAEIEAARGAVARYQAHLLSLPADDQADAQVRKRDNPSYRRARYASL
jgi:hypothetical protein